MTRRTVLAVVLGLLAAGVATISTPAADKPKADACCDGCTDCRTACLECVTACLEETGRKECIKLCLDCADVCDTCSKISARKGPTAAAMMAVCADTCEKCAAECGKHKDDKACQACAEQCKKCAAECKRQASKK